MRSRHGHFRGDKPGADDKSARCAFSAESQWIFVCGSRPGGRKKKNDRGEPSGPCVTSAVSLRLFLRRSRLATRNANQPAKKLHNAAPYCATLLGYLRGGIFPLRRNGDQRRRNSWATPRLQLRRLCFRPAGVKISSGTKTDHGEPIWPRATLAVSPWLFLCRP